MVRDDPAGIRDGETLRRLDSGLEIQRRLKHEPVDFSSWSPAELEEKTDERHGSKFLPEWSLQRVTNWTAQAVADAGWTLRPGIKRSAIFQFEAPVGIVRGRRSYKIKIVSDGRYVHAYPVGEDR